MTLDQLKDVVHREPFHPYRLRLCDGEEILVRKPRKSSVSGDQVALVGECKKIGSDEMIERFRIVRIEKIMAAEMVV